MTVPVVNPNIEKPPWCHLPKKVVHTLWEEGLLTPEAVGELTSKELIKRTGLTRYYVNQVHAVIPLRTAREHQKVVKAETKRSVQAARTLTQEAARVAFERRVVVIERIIDDEDVDANTKLRAMDMLGRYGVGKPESTASIKTDDVRELVRALALATDRFVIDGKHEEMSREWVSIIRDRFPVLE